MNPRLFLFFLALFFLLSGGRSQAAESSGSGKDAEPEVTPLSLPGSNPVVFKEVGGVDLLFHLVKPEGWSPNDKRPCLVAFFGGGWATGTPENSVGWAKWAAERGMVGVAPDYRTRKRFNTTPEDSVADGRAAVRWLQDHAKDLGIDPTKVVVMGTSSGGHLAAWTCIPDPVSSATASDPFPSVVPAALVLLWPVTDTTEDGYGGPKRFGGSEERAAALSVTARMPTKMPPTLVIHGTADETVKFENSKAFVEKMKANGNACELIPLQDMPHSPSSTKFGDVGKQTKRDVEEHVEKFLASLQLIDR